MNHNRGRLDIKYMSWAWIMRTEDAAETKRKQDDLSPYPMTWASSEVLETLAGQDNYNPSLQIVSHCRGNKDTPQKAGAKQQNHDSARLRFICVGIFFCNLRCSIYHLAFYFTYTSLHLAFTYNNTHVKIDNLNIFLAIDVGFSTPFRWSCQPGLKWPGFGEPGYGDTVTGYWLNLAGDTEKLGCGFKYFLFSPRKLGKLNPFWLIFFKGVETTT